MKKIIEWFKNIEKQKNAENEIVDTIIKTMREESDKWNVDEYYASYGRLRIWICNSPYADMTLNERRLPRRGELREALVYCLLMKAKSDFVKHSQDILKP